MSFVKHIIAALLASSFATSALAAPIIFDLTTPTSRTGILNSTYAMGYSYAGADGVSLSLTGWSYGTTSNVVNGRRTLSNTNSTTAHQDIVGNFINGSTRYGLGVEYADSPEHAINNAGNDFDMLLLSFSEAVSLNSINLGWIENSEVRRSDVSVLAGTSTTFASPNGKTWQSLVGVGQGWKLAGQYNNAGSGNELVNANNISSKYWLVGAYNGLLGSSLGNDGYSDAFKLKGVSVTKTIVKVPEPSALFLFGLGLLGLVVVRRRQQ